MKVSAIPAQITTIEDRIAGNLSLTQLFLLAVPLFITAVIFFLLPPVGRYALYKLVVSIILISISSPLAIRINDKLILDLIKLRLSFELRPHIYAYRKGQSLPIEVNTTTTKQTRIALKTTPYKASNLSLKSRTKGEKLLRDDKYHVTFKSKSGGLVVKVSAP